MRPLLVLALVTLLGCVEDGPPLHASPSAVPVYEAAITAALFTAWGIDTLQFAPRQPTSLVILDQVEHGRWGTDYEGHRRWLLSGMPMLPPDLAEAFTTQRLLHVF